MPAGEGEVTRKLPDEIGVSGLARSGGFVQEEFLPELAGERGLRVYREIRDNDPIGGALIMAITNLMRQIKWGTKPANDTPEALKGAEFLRECMDDMSMTWADVISEVCSMFPFGWALLEPLYKKRSGYQPEDSKLSTSKYDDGRIGWRKMPLRAQETLVRWEFDEHGQVAAMHQNTVSKGIVQIPITSALLFRTQAYKGNPEGRSLFRNGYRPWYFKKRIEEIEAIGVERDLAGLPYMYVPPEWLMPDTKDKYAGVVAEYTKMIQNVRRDKQEGFMLPFVTDDQGNKIIEFGLLTSGGARQFDTDGIISRYTMHMALTVLADWLVLGHEQVGSFALSNSKTNLFGIALGAWKDSILAVFNNYAVPRLWRMNGWSMDTMPTITAEDIESPDLAVIGSFLGALAASGAPPFPNRELTKRLYQMAGFPEPNDDELDSMEEAARNAAQQGINAPPTTPEEDAALQDMAGV